MSQINPDSVRAVQPELTSGETVLWAGRPSASVLFHKEDIFLVPFSLMWGGFAIFWELGAAGFWGSEPRPQGPWVFGLIWGIPFVLVGQYVIWGRFVLAAWKKKRTHYAVTNQRVVAVQFGWRRQMASSYIDTLPGLTKAAAAKGIGTLWFFESPPMWSARGGWQTWDAMSMGNILTFRDIEDVDSVYRLVSELREKARAVKKTF